MNDPSKERRKEIRRKLKEEEDQKWRELMEIRNQKIANMASTLELKEYHSVDRDLCDVLCFKLSTMLAQKEIRILQGSLDWNNSELTAAFIHLASQTKWLFHCWDAMRSGGGYLKML